MATKLTRKKPNFANARSHALNATKKKQGINLQKMNIGGLKVRLSAREMRTIKKLLND